MSAVDKLRWHLGLPGHHERAARAHVDAVLASGRALSWDEGNELTDSIWAAQEADRWALFGDRERELG